MKKKQFLKKVTAALLSSALLFSLAACGTAVQNPPVDVTQAAVDETRKLSSMDNKADKVIIAIAADPTDMTPTNPNATGKNVIIPEIFETLFDLVGSEYVPVLAEGYTVIDDTHWQVKIKDYIHDSEGNPITADDVLYSYQWLDDTGLRQKYDLFGGIEKVGDYTVEFTWTAAPTALAALDWIWGKTYIFSQAAEQSHNFATEPVGTGPYTLSSFTSGSSVLLEANENYWEKPDQILDTHTANVQTIEYRVITEASQRLIGLQSGTIDYAEGIDQNSIGDFREGGSMADKYQVYNSYDNRVYYMFANQSAGKAGEDENFRLACYYAVSNEAIANVLGNAVPAVTMGSPFFSDYQAKWETDENYITSTNVELAKQYLEQSSYDGEKLTLMTTNNDLFTDVATIVQNMLLQVGIDCKIVQYEQATLDVKITEPDSWDIACVRCGHSSYMVSAWNNPMNAADRATKSMINLGVDDKLTEWYNTCSTQEGHTDENMDAMQQYWIENAYFNPLVVYVTNTVYSTDIANLFYRDGALVPGACSYYLD